MVKTVGAWCAVKDVESHEVNISRSAVLLEGEKSEVFNVEQGVAQGCNLFPILFFCVH